MIDIGSSSFLIKVPSLPEREFERYSSNLFDQWEENVQRALLLPDYSISLEVEEGSISGRAKIAAAAGAIYMGIANYGGFISGLETIRGQVSYVNNLLFDSARAPFNCTRKNSTVRNSGGALSKLHGLFQKVQSGVLTADEAMLQAKEIFGPDGENIPGLMKQLKDELKNAPRHPEQLSLIEENQEECSEILIPPSQKPSKKPAPKPIPASQQFKIEIWRESRRDKKHVKLTRA